MQSIRRQDGPDVRKPEKKYPNEYAQKPAEERRIDLVAAVRPGEKYVDDKGDHAAEKTDDKGAQLQMKTRILHTNN